MRGLTARLSLLEGESQALEKQLLAAERRTARDIEARPSQRQAVRQRELSLSSEDEEEFELPKLLVSSSRLWRLEEDSIDLKYGPIAVRRAEQRELETSTSEQRNAVQMCRKMLDEKSQQLQEQKETIRQLRAQEVDFQTRQFEL